MNGVNVANAPAIDGPPSPYDSSIYYYHSYEKEPKNDRGVVISTEIDNILIQTTTDGTTLYIIDVLAGNYIGIPYTNILKDIGFAIETYLSNTYKTKYSMSKITKILHAQIKDDYLFNYFLERCSPLPILPVIIGQTRYFINADIEDEDEDEDVPNTGLRQASAMFHQSAYEDNEEVSQTLISECPGGTCTFKDPMLGTTYNYSVVRKNAYIEKSKDDYKKIIQRLTPTIIPKIKNITLLGASIIEKLGPVFDVNKPIAKVIDVIQENFGKHISLDDHFQSLISNPSPNNRGRLDAIADEIATKKPEPIPLLTQISDDIGGDESFKVISFLRSYIDLFHDITIYGKEYCGKYYDEFIKTITPQAQTFLSAQIALINKSIFTKSDNINQDSCREQIERIADLFIKYLHENGIQTNPREKESAFVMQASIDNPSEMESLIATLTADGVTGFYVESANNNIGEMLVKAGLPLYNITIGEWDAGSGFSGKSLKAANKPKNIIQIGPAETGATVILPNMPIDMFGLFRVEVAPDNNTLGISYKGAPVIYINPLQKLSVDALLIAAGKVAIRGPESRKTALLKFTSNIEKSGDALIPLKPWTDLVQIKTLADRKILTIYYDRLAETTARIYGLYYVLLCQGKILTYYSYNINSRNLTEDQIYKRVLLRHFIETNAVWIKGYLNAWFIQRINTLEQLMNISYDPILFFISKVFINKYIMAKDKSFEVVDKVSTIDIKSIPDTFDKYIESVSSSGTLLADLLELYSKFETAIKEFEKVGSRGNKDNFLNAYAQIKQLIVDTFKTDDVTDNDISLRAMIASTFAYNLIKNPRYTPFLTKLEDIKRVILLEQYPDKYPPNIKNEFGVEINAIAYNPGELAASLSQIKESKNDAVRNIVDIQIAIQTLLTLLPGYPKYIQQVSIGKIDTNPEYSFGKVITHVTNTLNSVIGPDKPYFGGNKRPKKLSKTRKQKRTKRKTYKKRK